MKTSILLSASPTFEMNDSSGYVIGAVIAVLILFYLLYSLFRPEKF